MLKLITGPVEILHKDMESQAFPICDSAGFTIAEAETYGHALEISEAVSNYNRVVGLLQEARLVIGSRGDRARKVQKKIGKFLQSPTLTH